MLDVILLGSREYAKRLGERLKENLFVAIFPHLAQGFLEDRKHRLLQGKGPPEEELAYIFEATLTLLYRLLFPLDAESRDLLPIREAPYHAASLKKIKEEIAGKAGGAESGVTEALRNIYSAKETTLYDRLCRLFQAMDKGDPILNVPTYNGGLFNTSPQAHGQPSVGLSPQRIARFLLEHKVPGRYLALAIDRLARDQDERTLALVFIDYKSLEVRHLGSIYEGLLEFKLKVAGEDLTTQADKKGEKYIPLSQAKVKRGRQAEIVVRKKEDYLSNDKAERKASGSYYTPDPIVEYIVANTVGPVLEEKLESLRPDFRTVRKTFDRHLQNAERFLPKPTDGRPWASPREYALQQTYNAHKDLVESLFDLRVLDPAMGSGHFLVETVDFITDHLLKFLNQFPINPVNSALDRTRASILESLREQGVFCDDQRLTDINLLKRHGGRLGHIVPMPFLGDEQAVGVRKMLLSKSCLAAVEAFPQKDEPRNRVFEDAKLSTCIFVTTKKNEDIPFRARIHPGKVIEAGSPSLIVRRSQVKLYDPENQPIVACSQEDWDLAVKIMGSGRMRQLAEFCRAYFRLGSTNAHVSHYQLYNLPAPAFQSCKPDASSTGGFVKALERKKWDDAFGFLESQLAKPPFSGAVLACLVRLVDEIARIKSARGDIARTERSALAADAQPYQDLIDRIRYRLAGLTEAEAKGLEKRLEGML